LQAAGIEQANTLVIGGSDNAVYLYKYDASA
jgi:hypothetical protein